MQYSYENIKTGYGTTANAKIVSPVKYTVIPAIDDYGITDDNEDGNMIVNDRSNIYEPSPYRNDSINM